ncbi:acylphosphatase [Pseudomaricurvus alcaniphilus]|uniref:acylphosphatase n=1 Tax=Pseudomaricurvus alcaniphilus TaxID=1166482 RepID=UPI001409B148|nr:acylphosphatase [Pseudomaricurvus alcaniphilus]NHN39777.1 acylphosphatase [Pseudomaricurvus alcaniphilus]
MAKHLKISGLVQGVWFRKSMQQQAEQLGVQGWVRNRREGTVEALVDGPDSAVEAMLAWAQQGPPSAQVEHVQVSDVQADEPTDSYDSFELRPST